MHDSIRIFSVFALLSVLAIGGGTAVLPEMKHLTIDTYHWLDDDQFRDIYGLGQLAPGPNLLMVVVIGYHVAGSAGALLAFVGFFLPASVIALTASRVWNRFAGSPWRLSVQRALGPISIGLMIAGIVSVARTAISGVPTALLAVAVFAVLSLFRRLNPAWMILAAGLVGAAAFR
ncbi:chromate transporter [Chelatococcus reniformis]|uniref:Chromate transporter n=1 Tax=Chelatococcus reniformis TaxID=1494448 RepID=A0A916U1Q9_9HYPH|nr:chromate transporter [Chelatococcus reniformis]GGC56754.1 chromate transporter [Chelatococcus reniformis]